MVSDEMRIISNENTAIDNQEQNGVAFESSESLTTADNSEQGQLTQPSTMVETGPVDGSVGGDGNSGEQSVGGQ